VRLRRQPFDVMRLRRQGMKSSRVEPLALTGGHQPMGRPRPTELAP
jgi:hypothetical protein